MALERELATFRRNLPVLLRDSGNREKYALVYGDEVAGLFPSFDVALKQGYDRFGLKPFLIKEVTEHEEPKYFTRNVVPCQ